jgi:uncharacterized GH25 family protein
MKRSALRLAVCALLGGRLAEAHDLWIEPSTFHPVAGEEVSAALRVGANVQGEALPMIPQLQDRFLLRSRAGEVSVDGEPGQDPAGFVRVAEPGLQWIGYQSRAFPTQIDCRTFEGYLVEEGLERIVRERERTGTSARPGRERFYRCAKALLEVGGAKGNRDANVVDGPLGFTLELVPRRSPHAMRPGENLPLTLLFRGLPIEGVLVVAMSKDDPEKAVRARTDAAGQVTLPIGHSGFWLVKAVHMEAAAPGTGVDWESWWASLTFDLSGASRDR